MKKILIFLSPLLMTLFIGCGGGDNNVPPPCPAQLGMNNPTDQKQLQDLMNLANATKQSCAAPGASSMLPVLMMMNNPSAANGQMPMIPPLDSNCSNTFANFILMFATMKNGSYAAQPAAQSWFASQIGGIINRVGMMLQSQGYPLTPDVQQKLLVAAGTLVNRDVLAQPALQPYRAPLCSGAAGFGFACP
jgi:hypothetical protein